MVRIVVLSALIAVGAIANAGTDTPACANKVHAAAY